MYERTGCRILVISRIFRIMKLCVTTWGICAFLISSLFGVSKDLWAWVRLEKSHICSRLSVFFFFTISHQPLAIFIPNGNSENQLIRSYQEQFCTYYNYLSKGQRYLKGLIQRRGDRKEKMLLFTFLTTHQPTSKHKAKSRFSFQKKEIKEKQSSNRNEDQENVRIVYY